jgi:hypothetical protein
MAILSHPISRKATDKCIGETTLSDGVAPNTEPPFRQGAKLLGSLLQSIRCVFQRDH